MTQQTGRAPVRTAPGAPGSTDVPATLEHFRALVAPALRETVRRLPPEIGTTVEFTLGWRDADGTPRSGGSGKGLRPALALLTAQAVGAAPESAVPGALAVELVHTFSLVHDDIIDGDEQRRHREAVWKAYGVGTAVLAGDALLALALDVLSRAAGGERGAAAMKALSGALVELVNGQAEDVSFELRPWTGPRAVTVAEYSAMAGRKTGSLLGCATGLGALLGGAAPGAVSDLTLMGRHLGLAFQAVDDLLGIWGDPGVTGKPVHSDLRQGKKTLPIVSVLAQDTPAARRLAALLADPGSGGEEALRGAADLIEEAGGRALAADSAERHLCRARQLIHRASADAPAAAALADLGEFVVHRTH
ncbi:polyprenyl synthetase family protein [Streptomyces sp. NPDC001478]